MELMKQTIYFLLWLIQDKSAEYKPRSYLPKYEIEAIVRTFFPAVAAFFETEEGNREFEEWKAKKEAEMLAALDLMPDVETTSLISHDGEVTV